MKDLYSTYEAKSRLSEILRQVRAGKTIRISYRGEPVAEIRPIRGEPVGFEGHLQELVQAGTVRMATHPVGGFSPVKRVRGGLERFIAERDS